MIKDNLKPDIVFTSNKKWTFTYIARGWAIIPLYEANPNGCACGNSKCSSPGKHPRTPNGVKDRMVLKTDP